MPWSETDEERRLRLADIIELTEVVGAPGHANVTVMLTFEDGSGGVFKPQDGERPGLRNGIPVGTYWRREVSAYRLDRMLGFDLVPATVVRDVEGRTGSVQNFVDEDGRAIGEYDDLDRQRLGILDYILANTDRHGANWMTQATGRPAAIDNGLALPRAPVDPVRSPWTWSCLNQPLDPEPLEGVRALDEAAAVGVLKEMELEDDAIQGFLSRLAEVRTGTITGVAWGGPIAPG